MTDERLQITDAGSQMARLDHSRVPIDPPPLSDVLLYALCPMLFLPVTRNTQIVYLTTQTVRPRAIWITLLVTLPMKNVLTCDKPRLPITIVS